MRDLPPGVVNILTGAGETGAAIVNHPGIDKIAFTGSHRSRQDHPEVARRRRRKSTRSSSAARPPTSSSTTPPIDQAVEGIINGIFFNQGHVCCAGSRLFMQESVHDLVIRKLKDRMQTLIVGDPLDKNTDIGAINSKCSSTRSTSISQIGEDEGAEMWQRAATLPERGFCAGRRCF